MLTIAEVCAKMGYSPSTVYRLIRTGKLRAYKNPGASGRVRISEAQLDEYLAGAEMAAQHHVADA